MVRKDHGRGAVAAIFALSTHAHSVRQELGSKGRSMVNGADARLRDVSEHLRDLRFSTIELRERLEGLERDWLVGRLRATRGVRDIEYGGDDGRRLVIEH